jgi:hypothetical protein
MKAHNLIFLSLLLLGCSQLNAMQMVTYTKEKYSNLKEQYPNIADPAVLANGIVAAGWTAATAINLYNNPTPVALLPTPIIATTLLTAYRLGKNIPDIQVVPFIANYAILVPSFFYAVALSNQSSLLPWTFCSTGFFALYNIYKLAQLDPHLRTLSQPDPLLSKKEA